MSDNWKPLVAALVAALGGIGGTVATQSGRNAEKVEEATEKRIRQGWYCPACGHFEQAILRERIIDVPRGTLQPAGQEPRLDSLEALDERVALGLK